jgi:DNA-binding transcriptional ArsR family regulator
LVQAIAARRLGDGRESPEGLTISRLAASFEISRFSASRHLGILRAAGVLDVQHDGQRALHTLSETAFDGLEDWLYAVLDGVRPDA